MALSLTPINTFPLRESQLGYEVKSQNSAKFRELKQIVSQKLHTVCEEAMCPNIQECWVTVLQPLCYWDLFAPGRANFVL